MASEDSTPITIQAAAKAVLPADYALVTEGVVAEGDLLWNYVDRKWMGVCPPLPVEPDQERPGSHQITDIGTRVSEFFAVARRQPKAP
jgi:hypothetical protein